jgi:hypothetical protein
VVSNLAWLIVGGETPINSGIELAQRLSKEIPEFYDQLAAKVSLQTLICLTEGFAVCVSIYSG